VFIKGKEAPKNVSGRNYPTKCSCDCEGIFVISKYIENCHYKESTSGTGHRMALGSGESCLYVGVTSTRW
jgi:hypothetical protein